MRKVKQRVTVTLDPDLVRAGSRAVSRGDASSLSEWVSRGLVNLVAEERRLAAMDEAIAMYEARHGKFTEEELAEQRRADRENAIRYPRRRGRRRRAA
jgi:hypothetical protein